MITPHNKTDPAPTTVSPVRHESDDIIDSIESGLSDFAASIRQHAIVDVETIADLVREDMQRRTNCGELVQLEGYLDELPQLLDAPLELVALILDEHSIRAQAGQVVEFNEYARRFPDHRETLRLELASVDTELSISACDVFRDITVNSQHRQAEFQQREMPTVEVGQTIGDFRLEEFLGAGGVSKVYRANQLSLDRDVALKVTVDEGNDSSDEGRTMALLVHDHIVPVHTEQFCESIRVLAMEYVAGPTLGEFLDAIDREKFRTANACLDVIVGLSRTSELSDVAITKTSERPGLRATTATQFVCSTIRDLASALSHAHQRGVLHCDVKPANVLFAPDGRAMLTDFNVSIRNQNAGSSQSTPPGGTLAYMAPEHLALLSGADSDSKLDARSDVYSLGIVFFELVTGRWPFCEFNVSNDPLIAAGHRHAVRIGQASERFDHDNAVSPGLRSIINKCLSHNLADRYQSADELVEDLDRFLTNRPLRFAQDPCRLERAFKRVRRHARSLVALVSVVGMLIAITAAWGRANRVLADDSQRPFINAGDSRVSNAQRASDFEAQGQGFFLTHQFDNAALCFMQAVQLNPKSVTAQHNLAVAQFRLGRFVDAVESFDRVIELGNQSALVYSRRATARFGIGDTRGAAADFKLAESLAVASELDEIHANMREFERRRNP